MNNRLSILHLEDNPGDAELIGTCLEADGLNCEIEVVNSGSDFNRKISMRDYDLILSDYTMPGFSGKDALGMATSYAPETPFIFVSGTIGEELALESLELGASDYILKSHPLRLPAAVRRAISDATTKRELAALTSVREFQSELLANLEEAIFVVDGKGLIVFWNEGASKLFEYSGKSPVGLSATKVDDLCGCEFFREIASQDLVRSEKFERLCDFNSGARKWISATQNTSINTRSHGRLNLFVVRNISEGRDLPSEPDRMSVLLEQKVLERTSDLTTKNAELLTYSYSVSHDLQTPLQVILGYSVALAEECEEGLGIDGRLYVNRIVAAGMRMDQLITGLLHLATLDSRQLHRSAVDVTSLCHEISELLLRDLIEPSVHFSIQDGMRVFADPRMMRSVFENLMSNAMKFSAVRPDAQIEVGTCVREGKPMFFVRDNGTGFSQEDAASIFEPFKRLQVDERNWGHGIGLATVKRIVEKHGGVIMPYSEPDQGAIFFFSIPEIADRGAFEVGPWSAVRAQANS